MINEAKVIPRDKRTKITVPQINNRAHFWQYQRQEIQKIQQQFLERSLKL